jgi:outer membrane protein, heavy metal efflux system
MKKALAFFLLALAVPVPGPAQSAEPASLDDLIKEAVSNNPQLRAARLESAAAETRISQATSLDPPQVGIEFYQTPLRSFPNPIHDGQETDYSFQQMFPFPGKLKVMGRSARNFAGMSGQKYVSLERQVIRDLKVACYELYLSERKIEINTRNQDLLRDLLDVAGKRYEVGMGNQADILRAQTELSMLQTSGLKYMKDGKVARAEINTLLSRPVETPLATVAGIEEEMPTWSIVQLDSLTLEVHPELKGMRYNIEMNKAELSLARRELRPDIMLRLMYKNMEMTNENYWSTMIGVSVPQSFWSRRKYQSRIEENRLRVEQAESEYSSRKNMLIFQVHSAFENMTTNKQVLKFYDNTIIPQAEQSLQSTLAAYRAGTLEFLMVIDAERMLLQARFDYQEALMSYMASLADLEQSVGIDLGRLVSSTP